MSGLRPGPRARAGVRSPKPVRARGSAAGRRGAQDRARGGAPRAQGGRAVLASAASADLPPGLLDLSLTEPGVKDEEALSQALAGLLERAEGFARGAAALVLPDPVGRISVLPAHELLGKRGAGPRGAGALPPAPVGALRGQGRAGWRWACRPAGAPIPRWWRPSTGPCSRPSKACSRATASAPALVELSSLALLALLEPARRRSPPRELGRGLRLARARPRRLAAARAHPARGGGGSRRPWGARWRTPCSTTGSGWAGRRSRARASAAPASRRSMPWPLLREPLGMTPVVLDPWAAFGGGEPQAGQLLAGALAAAGRGVVARRAA